MIYQRLMINQFKEQRCTLLDAIYYMIAIVMHNLGQGKFSTDACSSCSPLVFQ